jgi:two-component system sensor histidine kinase BaeS
MDARLRRFYPTRRRIAVKSLLHKLFLSSLVIILLPISLAILWTSETLTAILERQFADKSEAQAEQVKLLLSERQETATGLVHWIAEMPGVRDALKRNDRALLFQQLLPLVGSVQMDFIEILDPKGKIFLRVHDPSVFGDRPPLAKDIQRLLQGSGDLSNYGVEERGGRAYLRAAEEIEDGKIFGVVSAGYAVNRDFIKHLEQIAGGKVAIAIGERLYTAETTGPEKSPGRAPENVSGRRSEWHRDERAPSLEVRLPLLTDRGSEGLISIFYPSQQLTATLGTLQKMLYSVAFIGIICALSISWILSRRLTQPLKQLVSATEQVAAGDYSAAISSRSKDEIGALAASFNRMLAELSRSRAEVESYRRELERKFDERSKELADTEKKRAAMAHMIAHDLKNPLLGIKKTLERLEQAPPEANGEQRKKILQDLVSAGDLVIGMVNEMLDIYRSDFGDLPLALAPCSVEEVVQTSLRILGPEIEDKGIEVVTGAQPLGLKLVADKRRLTRLLINLLSNAIKFSPHRSRIEITSSLVESDEGRGPRAVIRVADQGEGIPSSDLPKIFEVFYSRDQGLDAGTGLGLPYCKLVAEAHRGKIWAESDPGKGFAVSIALPLNPEEEPLIYADQNHDRR